MVSTDSSDNACAFDLNLTWDAHGDVLICMLKILNIYFQPMSLCWNWRDLELNICKSNFSILKRTKIRNYFCLYILDKCWPTQTQKTEPGIFFYHSQLICYWVSKIHPNLCLLSPNFLPLYLFLVQTWFSSSSSPLAHLLWSNNSWAQRAPCTQFGFPASLVPTVLSIK